METVKISPKYQVVIPKAIRESLQLQSGQRMQVIEYNDRIELVPEKKMSDMLGFLKGITSEVKRENDRL